MLNIIKKEEEGKLLFELEGRLDTITAPDLEKDLMSSLEGNALTLALEGRLDTMTAPELEAELNASLGSAETLTFDFSKLEYISSAGLRVLLSAHKATAGKAEMKIVHVNDIIMEIFETTGFSDILDIE